MVLHVVHVSEWGSQQERLIYFATHICVSVVCLELLSAHGIKLNHEWSRLLMNSHSSLNQFTILTLRCVKSVIYRADFSVPFKWRTWNLVNLRFKTTTLISFHTLIWYFDIYLDNIFDTQPWLTRNCREISHGRTPLWASSTIRWRTTSGNGRPAQLWITFTIIKATIEIIRQSHILSAYRSRKHLQVDWRHHDL